MLERMERIIVVESRDNLAATPASGPVAAIDLKRQIADADLIIAATVMKTGEAYGPVSRVSAKADPAPDRLCQAELAVVRRLAGEPAQSTVSVFFLQGKTPARPWAGLVQGETVLMFLRSICSGYAPVDPMAVPLQTLPDIAAPPADASKVAAVAHELEQIILKAETKSQAGLITQAAIARAALQGKADAQRLDTRVLQDPLRRAAWVAIALAEGKIEVLSEVGPLLADSAMDAAETLRVLLIQKVSEVRASAARHQLAALSQNARVDLARASASALRQLHDPLAIPDLIEMLNNADLEVRYQAIMGLAELETSVEAGPSFEVYRLDESAYIQYWKQWWRRDSRLNPAHSLTSGIDCAGGASSSDLTARPHSDTKRHKSQPDG